MSNEITLSVSVEYADSEGADVSLAIAELLASVATKKFMKFKQNIGFAAEEAIVLGEVTAPGWAIFINRDETNFIKLLTGTGGVIFAKLKPGEPAVLRLGSGAQAPYAQADTAACQMEVLLIST